MPGIRWIRPTGVPGLLISCMAWYPAVIKKKNISLFARDEALQYSRFFHGMLGSHGCNG
jgi:hypothetical protein